MQKFCLWAGRGLIRCIGPRPHSNVRFHCGLFTKAPAAEDFVIFHGPTACSQGAGRRRQSSGVGTQRLYQKMSPAPGSNFSCSPGSRVKAFLLLSNVDLKNQSCKTVDLKNFEQVSSSYLRSKASPKIDFLTHFFRYNVSLI
jgi:hypothetical protein